LTTLVAVQGDGWAAMGCDSRATDTGGLVMQLATHKIIENNGYLIAVSGASRGGNLVQFGWKPPKPRVGISQQGLDGFMTKTFIPALRKLFVDSGFDMKDDGDTATHDSNILVAVHGVIYPIFEDYSWDREERNIYIAGSGSEIALGAMEALNYKKCKEPEDAEKVIRRSIEIAKQWDAFTAGEIHTYVQYE